MQYIEWRVHGLPLFWGGKSTCGCYVQLWASHFRRDIENLEPIYGTGCCENLKLSGVIMEAIRQFIWRRLTQQDLLTIFKYKNSHINKVRLILPGFKVLNQKRNANGTISSLIKKDNFIIIKAGLRWKKLLQRRWVPYYSISRY